MSRSSARISSFLLGIALLGSVLTAAADAVAIRHTVPRLATPPPAPAAIPSGGSLVASMRNEPRTFNRYVDRSAAVETITMLTHGRLVRINRVTDTLEPMLAESWTRSKDGLTYTLKLRRDVKFSDGTAFTSADVVFTFRLLYGKYDDKTASIMNDTMRVEKKPLEAKALDASTVQVRFPAPYGPGLRILDNVPIYPKHLLEGALDAGTFAKAYATSTPPAQIVGLGAFVIREYVPGQRIVLERNPNYWRKDPSGARLPYLDRLTLELVKEQDQELLRLQSGQLDVTASELRAEDYALVKQSAAAGKVRLVDLGVGLDADCLWFNLRKDAKVADSKRAWLQHVELRRAVSEAVDRKHFADTVFLGAAQPVYGPVSPANKRWHAAQAPTPFDRKKAAARLAAIGLKNRNAEGILLDAGGQPVRLTLLTQKGNSALERGAAVIRDDLKAIGIGVDVVAMDPGAVVQRFLAGDYDAVYFRLLTSDTDPAGNLEFWLSAGSAHIWNPEQKQPATEWERQIDALMTKQASTIDERERVRLFAQAQKIFAEQLPMIYFAAPRVFVATSSRLVGVQPALMRPMVLWNADGIGVSRKNGTTN